MGLIDMIPSSYQEWADQIIKYTVLMYDKNSPYSDMGNFFERKSTCAEEAGFHLNRKNEFYDRYQVILNCSDEWYLIIALTYCREIGDMDWVQLITYTQQYYELQGLVMKPFSAEKDKDLAAALKTKIDLAKGVNVVKELIDSTMDGLLAKEHNQNLRDYTFKKASLETDFRPALSPEYYAQKA